MSLQQTAYSFDTLPLEPVECGTNIIVTGPALGGIRDLLLRMVLRAGPQEGALLVAADHDGEGALSAYERLGGDLDFARVGVVDCTEEGRSDESRNVHAVGSPSDLTGVGIEFSGLYESLVANGASHVRTGIYTLTPFTMYADARAVYRFLHTLTGRIRTADGLGVCAVDPETVDERTLSSLAHAFDGRVDLRCDDDPEIRVQGLPDQPDRWLPVDGLK
jgi:hypothetical protein